jgi:hypothetical protein
MRSDRSVLIESAAGYSTYEETMSDAETHGYRFTAS